MSCIPKLLEMKGEKEYLPLTSKVLLESGGKHKGYDYCVVINSGGNRCAYVAVESTHPVLKNIKDSYDYPDLDVHGGVTFCEPPDHLVAVLGESHSCGDVWIGFDAAHAGDRHDLPMIKKHFPKEFAILSSEPMLFSSCLYNSDFGVIRTNAYMTKQCKYLIKQLLP